MVMAARPDGSPLRCVKRMPNPRQSFQRLFRSPLVARFARGSFWSLAGTLFSQGLGLAASVFTVRMLGAVGYGELGMINSTVATLGAFAGMGLGLTATKYLAEYRAANPVQAGRILALTARLAWISSGIFALMLAVLAPILASRTLQAAHLSGQLALGSLILFFSSINGFQAGALAGFEAFMPLARIQLLRGLIYFPLVFLGVWLFGLTGAIVATILPGLYACWLCQRALNRECLRAGIPRDPAGGKAVWPVVWHFALPAFLSGILVTPFLWLAQTLLVNQPGGYGELGRFNVANQWRSLLLLMPNVFGSVSLPMLSARQQAPEDFVKTVELSQSLSLVIVIPVSIALFLASSWILLLYGPELATTRTMFICLLTGVAVSGIGSVGGSVIQASGRMWLGALMNLTWGLALVGLTYAGVPRFGGLGLALAFTLAYLLLGVWAYLFMIAKRLIPRMVGLRFLGGVAMIVGVAALACRLSRMQALAALVPAAGLGLWVCLQVLSPPFIRRRVREMIWPRPEE